MAVTTEQGDVVRDREGVWLVFDRRYPDHRIEDV